VGLGARIEEVEEVEVDVDAVDDPAVDAMAKRGEREGAVWIKRDSSDQWR
jgi:hypothetical protein